MNLQKNDKIIAIGAVIILVLAAIGIIFYYQPEDEDSFEPTDEELRLFKVDRTEIPLNILNEVGQVKDKLFGSQDYETSFDVNTKDLKEVIITINYTDNRMANLIPLFSQDILTVMLYKGETEVSAHTIQGSGELEITLTGSTPMVFSEIYAEDKNEANEKFEKNMTSTGETETYTVYVSVKNGESGLKMIFRPLRWLLEKFGKDSFDIKITSYHYNYQLKEDLTNMNDDGGDDKPNSYDDDDVVPQTYSNLIQPMGKY